MRNVSRFGGRPSRLPQRVAVGLILPSIGLAIGALSTPGYLRPGAWRTVYVAIVVLLFLIIPITYWVRRLPVPVVIGVVILMDGMILVADLGVRGAQLPLSITLIALPTVFVALFLTAASWRSRRRSPQRWSSWRSGSAAIAARSW